MNAILALVATSAALTAPTAIGGTSTFYSNTDFTGTRTTISVADCKGAIKQLAGHYGSADNRPAAGCKVQLYANASPNWVTLCVGRSVLPAFVRTSPAVRFVPGTAPACPIVAG